MLRAKTIGCAALLLLIGLGLASSTAASDDAFKIIVHRDNPVASVERAFLRDAFLKKTGRWPHGEAVHPIDLPKASRVRDRFTEEVVGKTPSQLRNYWAQRIFSGTDVPPPEARSPESAIASVLSDPGAVAYVPVDVDTRGVKVISIK